MRSTAEPFYAARLTDYPGTPRKVNSIDDRRMRFLQGNKVLLALKRKPE